AGDQRIDRLGRVRARATVWIRLASGIPECLDFRHALGHQFVHASSSSTHAALAAASAPATRPVRSRRRVAGASAILWDGGRSVDFEQFYFDSALGHAYGHRIADALAQQREADGSFV